MGLNKNFITSILLITSVLFLYSPSNYAQVKGGRWTFENIVTDEATWDEIENNGSLSGDAFFSNADPVIQDSYFLSLEDSANYGVFTVANQAELNFENEALATSLWFYPTKSYDNPQYLFMKGDRSGSVKTNNYALRINNGTVELIVHAESGANRVGRSSFKVANNEWNFVAVFYDYDQSKLYMWNDSESAPIDTIDFTAPLYPNNLKLYVGTSGENGYKRFWGRIDDLRISNKITDIIDNATDIETPNNNSTLAKFSLEQNYPNPFNPTTSIKYLLEQNGFTKLDVYNIIGEHIVNLVNNNVDAGEYTIEFKASTLPSGFYFYTLQQGSFIQTKKMILIK